MVSDPEADAALVRKLSRLAATAHKRGFEGGAARDELWDLVSSNITTLLRLARAGVKAKTKRP